MFYLIEYDRERGELLRLQRFDEDDAEGAAQARLELELDLARRRVAREVVLLEAATDEDLRNTHRRYFVGIAELADSAPASAHDT